jgi:hypothetical protein
MWWIIVPAIVTSTTPMGYMHEGSCQFLTEMHTNLSGIKHECKQQPIERK